ncbi:MAG: hypothetical protein DMD49_03470 [Gemmatimonadetes bacterium]|nr:MAG: hypothetical protein DMD49_03470 [Gemmatimonadota bacterium]
MADDVKALSAQLAQDPASLVFLRLGELLRQRGQLDAAHRVALGARVRAARGGATRQGRGADARQGGDGEPWLTM